MCGNRKKKLYIIPFVSLLVIAVLLNGCNFPAQEGESAPTREAAYTAAAQTVIAQLTDVALTAPPASPTVTLPPVASPTNTVIVVDSTPTQTDTPGPTQTPTLEPSPTSVPGDPKGSLGEPAWSDDFSNDDDWSVYEDEYVWFRVRENVLLMTAFNADGRDSWMLAWPEPINYYIELVATVEECSGLDRYGVIFRTDATQGYLFGISCDGQYSLRLWDGESFDSLVSWTSSPHLLAGSDQTNRIGVMVSGEEFTLYANGYRLDEVNDDTLAHSGFGVFIGAKETEDFKVQVSEITYWDVP